MLDDIIKDFIIVNISSIIFISIMRIILAYTKYIIECEAIKEVKEKLNLK